MTVKVNVERYLSSCNHFLDHMLGMPNSGEGMGLRFDPVAIQIAPSQRSAAIPVIYPVWIKHRDDFEEVHAAQQSCKRAVPKKELDGTFHQHMELQRSF